MSDYVQVCPDGFHLYEYNPDRRQAHIVRTNRDKTYTIIRKDTREIVADGLMTDDEVEAWFYDDKGKLDFVLNYLRGSVVLSPGTTLEDIAHAVEQDEILSFYAPYLFPYVGAVGLSDDGPESITVSMQGHVVDGQMELRPQGVSLRGNPVVELSKTMFLYCNGTRYMGHFWWSLGDFLMALFGDQPEDADRVVLTKTGVHDQNGSKMDLLDALPRFCEVEEGVTLLDVFRLVDEEAPIGILFQFYSWCHGGVEQFHKAAQNVVKESHAEFLWAEVYASMDMELRQHKDDIKPYDFSISHDFHIWGKISDKEREEHPDWYEGRDKQAYGVTMTPIGHYAWLPLRLDNEIKVSHYRTDLREEVSVVTCRRGITLLDILDAIYMEVSFVGSPEDQEKFTEDMMERVEEIKAGTAKTRPFEELEKEVKEENEKKCPQEDENDGLPTIKLGTGEDLFKHWEEMDKVYRPTEVEGEETSP